MPYFNPYLVLIGLLCSCYFGYFLGLYQTNKSTKAAYKKGRKDGLHDGLTRDRSGIHITDTGIYHFKKEESNVQDY